MTTYVVTDMEADGPHAGVHSMLSLASVACDGRGTTLDEFSAVLAPLPELTQDLDTLRWWRTQPEAWRAATEGARPAAEVIADYVAWLRRLPGPRVFVASPLDFDGPWVAWYLARFAEERITEGPRARDPLFHGGGLDLPSLAMGRLGWPLERCRAANYPAEWFGGHAHTHAAIDDARGYAALLTALLGPEAKRLAGG